MPSKYHNAIAAPALAHMRIFGLNVAFAGSAATSVLRYDTGNLSAIGADYSAYLSTSDSATAGFRVTPLQTGFYMVRCSFAQPASSTLNMGVGFGEFAANYTAVPAVGGTWIQDASTVTLPANTVGAWSSTCIVPVTGAMISTQPVFAGIAESSGIVSASTIVAARCAMEILYLGPLGPRA